MPLNFHYLLYIDFEFTIWFLRSAIAYISNIRNHCIFNNDNIIIIINNKRTKLIKTTCYIFNETVESFEFVVAQFSWYSLFALPHIFTSSTKTNFQRVSFLIEVENLCIHETSST